jgi:hypothetical protein
MTDAQTPQPGMDSGPGKKLRVAAVGDLHVGEAAKHPFQELFSRVGEDADVLCLCGDLVNFGKTSKLVYSQLTTDNPIDLTRYQLANCYMGRMGLINSGGASSGESDLKEAVKTAVINKRAGGMGLISGRKAFQRPMKDGAALLNAIQDVYLSKDVTVA